MRRATIDKKDRMLISRLIKNSREKLTDLAKALNISVTAVNKRMKKLEDMGVIMRYTANIDFNKLGYGVIALVRIAVDPPKRNHVISELKKVKNILEFYEVSGDYDIMAKLVAKDIYEYRDRVLTMLSKIDGIKKTSSMIVLGEHYCDPRELLEVDE